MVTNVDTEHLLSALVLLHQAALRVLTAHVAGSLGRCDACRAHWPRERAMLTAWRLEITS